jgi:hypothetical protein
MFDRVKVISPGNIRVRESSEYGGRGGGERVSVLVEDRKEEMCEGYRVARRGEEMGLVCECDVDKRIVSCFCGSVICLLLQLQHFLRAPQTLLCRRTCSHTLRVRVTLKTARSRTRDVVVSVVMHACRLVRFIFANMVESSRH